MCRWACTQDNPSSFFFSGSYVSLELTNLAETECFPGQDCQRNYTNPEHFK